MWTSWKKFGLYDRYHFATEKFEPAIYQRNSTKKFTMYVCSKTFNVDKRKMIMDEKFIFQAGSKTTSEQWNNPLVWNRGNDYSPPIADLLLDKANVREIFELGVDMGVVFSALVSTDGFERIIKILENFCFPGASSLSALLATTVHGNRLYNLIPFSRAQENSEMLKLILLYKENIQPALDDYFACVLQIPTSRSWSKEKLEEIIDLCLESGADYKSLHAHHFSNKNYLLAKLSERKEIESFLEAELSDKIFPRVIYLIITSYLRRNCPNK